MKTVACIGSQQTPQPILSWMEETGAALIRAGYDMRSGNAIGADQAWARGGNSVNSARVTLCLPWESFEAGAINNNPIKVISTTSSQHQRYFEAVKETHPAFGKLGAATLKLHARNAMIVEDAHVVLGSLNPGKPGGGGTGSAFRMAQRWGIITLNVADAFVRAAVTKRLATGEDVRGPVLTTGKSRRW